jgi:hypothetical protein
MGYSFPTLTDGPHARPRFGLLNILNLALAARQP